MKLTLPLLVALVSLPSFAQGPAKNTTAARQQIQGVIEDFRQSIIQRDKKKFLGLFLHDNVIFQPVQGEALLKQLRAKNPQASKAPTQQKITPSSFIADVAADKEPSEEKFSNIRIETDGDVAAVSFDFTFQLGERVINRGQEHWLLVKSDTGWKIASVVYSNND
ncbi:nuclear transport factor 2 family protein [Myxococcus stipitatus]|uniref:YybH family protein n=1 Tax=Myxococcus stipitatus TaxID=83455 RepID=UPI0031452F61